MSEPPAWMQEDNPFEDPAVATASTAGGAEPTLPVAQPADEPPSWMMNPSLDEPSKAAATGAPSSPYDQQPYNQTPASAPQSQSQAQHRQQQEDLGEMPREWMINRGLNVCCVIMMLATAIQAFIDNVEFAVGMLALYSIFFGLILCLFEMHLKSIATVIQTYFGFMYNPWGRVMFLVLCACLMFSMATTLAYASGALVCVAVPLNIYVLCTFPEWDRKYANAEIGGMRKSYFS